MKKSTFILFSYFLLQHSWGIAQTDKLVMDNYLKAGKILQKTMERYGGQNKINAPISFQLEGTKYFFGHYEVPEKLMLYLILKK